MVSSFSNCPSLALAEILNNLDNGHPDLVDRCGRLTGLSAFKMSTQVYTLLTYFLFNFFLLSSHGEINTVPEVGWII